MSIKSWRSKSATMLFTRPIYEREFPALAQAMSDDGLSIRLVNKGNGYELYVADYQVATKSVREVWGLSPHQMRRFIDWVLTNDTELM